MRRPHRVPLTVQALAPLEELRPLAHSVAESLWLGLQLPAAMITITDLARGKTLG
jgi:hypothetical protein